MEATLGVRFLAIMVLGVAMAFASSAGVSAAGKMNYNIKNVKGVKSIPESLTGKPGDAVKGREVAINRKKGNCLACHVLPIPEQPFHGMIGPELSDIAGRMSEGEIRLRVVDPKVVNPESIMPSFHRSEGLHRVLKKFKGKTVLSAEEVEDVIAYMMTLKSK